MFRSTLQVSFTMEQRHLSSIVIAIAVTAVVLPGPTHSLPTPTTNSSTGSSAPTPASLASSCVGGPLEAVNVNYLKLLQCALRTAARELSTQYNTTENGDIGRNYPAFNAELVEELTSHEQCLLPFYRQIKRYSSLVEKVSRRNIDRRFRRRRKTLQGSLQSLMNKLESACCPNGSDSSSSNATSCCSLMGQGLPEVSVAGVDFDDSALRNLSDSLYGLKSLDQCQHVSVKRSIRFDTKPAKWRKAEKWLKYLRKKSNPERAPEKVPTDDQDETTAAAKKDRVASVAENLTEQLANRAVAPDVKPTDALAAELDAKRSGKGGDLATKRRGQGRGTRRRRCRKGKNKRGRRCRGRKGRKNRGRGRKNRGRKNPGRKNRGGKNRRNGRNGSESQRSSDKN